MKNFLLFFILFVACYRAPSTVKVTEVSSKDSIAQLLYPELMNEFKRIKMEFKKSGLINQSLLLTIDSLQNDVIKYQGNALELKKAELKLALFTIQNKKLLKEIENLYNQNKEIDETNIFISDSLINTRINLYKTVAEKEAYKKEAGFKISHIRFFAFRDKKEGWLKQRIIGVDTTQSAFLTKYLEVSFDVPSNDKIDKTIYVLNVRIRGVHGQGINQDFKVNFTGGEQDNLKLKFDDPSEFQVGYHYADITYNNQSLYSGTIYLK